MKKGTVKMDNVLFVVDMWNMEIAVWDRTRMENLQVLIREALEDQQLGLCSLQHTPADVRIAIKEVLPLIAIMYGALEELDIMLEQLDQAVQIALGGGGEFTYEYASQLSEHYGVYVGNLLNDMDLVSMESLSPHNFLSATLESGYGVGYGVAKEFLEIFYSKPSEVIHRLTILGLKREE